MKKIDFLKSLFIFFISIFLISLISTNIANAQKQSQNSNITLIVNINGDDTNSFFPNRINQLDIIVNNNSNENFEGEIVVIFQNKCYRITNVFVNSKSKKKYHLHIFFPSYIYSFNVNLISSKNIIIYNTKINLSPHSLDEYHIYVASSSTNYLSYLKNLKLEKKQNLRISSNVNYYNIQNQSNAPKVNITIANTEKLLTNFLCYEPYSLIVINNIDISTLSDEQQDALINYVKNGGALLISYGGFISKLLNTKFETILPISIIKSDIINEKTFYEQVGYKTSATSSNLSNINIPISIGKLKDDAISICSIPKSFFQNINIDFEQIPIIAYKRFGNGIIYYLAFDISQVNLHQINYVYDNLVNIIKNTLKNDDTNLSIINYYLDEYNEQFISHGFTFPSIYITIILLIFFILLIGPIFYMVFRKKITFKLISIVPTIISIIFFIILSTFNTVTIADKAIINKFSIVLIDNLINSLNFNTNIILLTPPASKSKYTIDSNKAFVINNPIGYDLNEEGDIIINDEIVNLISPQLNYRYSNYSIIAYNQLKGNFNCKYIPTINNNITNISFNQSNIELQNNQQNENTNFKDGYDIEIARCFEILEKMKNSQNLTFINNNTNLDLIDCKIYYQGNVFDVGNLPVNFKKTIDQKQKFDSLDIFNNHIKQLITNNVITSIPINYENSYYYPTNRDYKLLKILGLYVVKQSITNPILVGFIKKNNWLNEIEKIYNCDTIDLGGIVIVKL